MVTLGTGNKVWLVSATDHKKILIQTTDVLATEYPP